MTINIVQIVMEFTHILCEQIHQLCRQNVAHMSLSMLNNVKLKGMSSDIDILSFNQFEFW